MSHPIITQPLPHDLRNWSFQGMNCEGWDFSGRDIRGCDFSRAKLAEADFSGVIAGRSQEQKIEYIKFAILLLPLSLILATLVAGITVVGILSVECGMSSSTEWFMISSAEWFTSSPESNQFRVPWNDNLAFIISIAIAFAIESMFIIPNTISAAIMSFGQGSIQYGLAWSVASVVILTIAFVMLSQAINRFKTETGTNFYSADLEGASFRNATLSNCNFDVACVKDVDWTNMTG